MIVRKDAAEKDVDKVGHGPLTRLWLLRNTHARVHQVFEKASAHIGRYNFGTALVQTGHHTFVDVLTGRDVKWKGKKRTNQQLRTHN